MYLKLMTILAVLNLLSGCAIKPLVFYPGEPLPRENVAVVSIVGLYPDRKLSLTIKNIDGKPIPATSEVHLLPGSYNFNIYVWHDFKPGWTTSSWKSVYVDTKLEVKLGHTYIPEATLDGDNVTIYFVDKGLKYPEECNPVLLFQANKSHDFCDKI